MTKPLNLVPQVTQVSYCVPIPLKVFRDRCCGPMEMDHRTYKYMMDRKPHGIDGVEFNGHFGSNIFFNAENDAARDAFVKVIHETLTTPKRQIPRKWY